MGCLTFPFLVKISVQTSFAHEADGDGKVAEFGSAKRKPCRSSHQFSAGLGHTTRTEQTLIPSVYNIRYKHYVVRCC